MQSQENLAFRALGDPTRRDILMLLANQELTVGEVGSHFDMTRAAVRKHLVILEQGNFIRTRAEGRERINSIHPEAFAPVRDWLAFFDRFWDDKLNALKQAVESQETDQ